ncbi:MAG: hypothetical protein HY709_09750, partial [Candidatus Latescibacteria bacterium]|nr:hypothetical protein [Candidatus Latescibacterota bacterium]
FFLEGTGLFQYGTSGSGGSGGNPLQLFHSRQIATQLPDGQKIPIDVAGKLSGKIGNWQVGLMNVQGGKIDYFGGAATEPKTSYSVARLRKNILGRSSVGFIGLLKDPQREKDPQRDWYNGVLGIDGEFFFGPTRQVEVLVAKSRTPRNRWTNAVTKPEEEWAMVAGTRWRSSMWGYSLYYADIGKDFMDEMGFVPRIDMRRYSANLSITPLIRKMGIRSSWSGMSFNYITDRENTLKTREIDVNPTFQFENGMWVWGGVNNTHDVLDLNISIAGIDFSKGGYTYTVFYAGLQTSRGARVSGEGSINIGQFYDADLQRASAALLIKPFTGLSLNPTFDWSRLEREDGSITRKGVSRVLSLRARKAITPDFYVSAYIQNRRTTDQNDQTTKTFISNALVAYQTPTGHAFYLAYNEFQEYNTLRERWEAVDRVLLAKLSYLWNI